MKINRLLEITMLLLNRGSATAKELSKQFGVSTRTIYRDIDVLSQAGVPVYTNVGGGGGISLVDTFTLNKALISEEEWKSLILALKTLQVTKYPNIGMILEKIGAIFKSDATDEWVHIDFAPWGSKPNENNKFSDIKSAIIRRMIVRFDYLGSDGTKTARIVEPMSLWFKGQSWYLWGYCKSRCDFRTFRISRIKNLSVTDKGFLRRKTDVGARSEAEGKAPPLVALTLRFQPDVLFRVYDDYDEECIVRNPDSTCDVRVKFPESDWIFGYILSFGASVEVLEPERIRLNIAEQIRKMGDLYKS